MLHVNFDREANLYSKNEKLIDTYIILGKETLIHWLL